MRLMALATDLAKDLLAANRIAGLIQRGREARKRFERSAVGGSEQFFCSGADRVVRVCEEQRTLRSSRKPGCGASSGAGDLSHGRRTQTDRDQEHQALKHMSLSSDVSVTQLSEICFSSLAYSCDPCSLDILVRVLRKTASLLSKRLECCFSEKILACHFTAVADRAGNFVATFARTWAIQRKPTLWRAWLRSVAGETRAKT